jgi:hypothetical protein
VEKRNAFPLGADSGRLVDQADAGGTAARERGVDVVDSEANVMDSWPPRVQKLGDRSARFPRFEELDERLAGRESDDGRAVGVIEWNDGESEYVAVKRNGVGERADGDADMGNTGSHAVIIYEIYEGETCRTL